MKGSSTSRIDVDALFTLPLGDFTSARNALAAQLKKAGRPAEANEVKGLPKPSVSAWVVNQLYWQQRALFDRLIEAGDRLRRAQAAPQKGESVREAVNARREAVTALVGIAAGMLQDGNYGATRDMLRRVTTTLEALSSYGSASGAPAAGRLTEDVEQLGFEAVTGLLPGSGKGAAGEARNRGRSQPDARAVKPPSRADERAAAARTDEKERKRRVAAAKTAAREAEHALVVARKQAERAAAKREAAEKRAKELDSELAEIKKRLARASDEAEAAHERARQAGAAAIEATQAVQGAERECELARGRLRQLTGTRQ